MENRLKEQTQQYGLEIRLLGEGLGAVVFVVQHLTVRTNLELKIHSVAYIVQEVRQLYQQQDTTVFRGWTTRSLVHGDVLSIVQKRKIE